MTMDPATSSASDLADLAPAGWYPATGSQPDLVCYWDGQHWCGPPVPGPVEDPRVAATKSIRSLFAWSAAFQVLLGLAWLLAFFVIIFTKVEGWDGRPLVEDYPSWLGWYWWYLLIVPIAAIVSVVGRSEENKTLVIAATVSAAVPVTIGWAAIFVGT